MVTSGAILIRTLQHPDTVHQDNVLQDNFPYLDC
jgi:hypothetical protein